MCMSENLGNSPYEPEERSDAWRDLGGNVPTVTAEQAIVMKAAGVGGPEIDKLASRSEGSEYYEREFGLSGQFVRSEEQSLALSSILEYAKKKADEALLASGESPALVLARRRAKDEKRKRRAV